MPLPTSVSATNAFVNASGPLELTAPILRRNPLNCAGSVTVTERMTVHSTKLVPLRGLIGLLKWFVTGHHSS